MYRRGMYTCSCIRAIFLLVRGYISWHIPVSYVGTVALFAWIFGARNMFAGDWVFHILAEVLILGAFFMATDYVTSPLILRGRLYLVLAAAYLL